MPKHNRTGQKVIAHCTIDPHSKQDLLVGIYENILPQPFMQITVTPSDVNLQMNLVRLDGYGEYALVYALHNTSDAVCEVTVKASWPDDIAPLSNMAHLL